MRLRGSTSKITISGGYQYSQKMEKVGEGIKLTCCERWGMTTSHSVGRFGGFSSKPWGMFFSRGDSTSQKQATPPEIRKYRDRLASCLQAELAWPRFIGSSLRSLGARANLIHEKSENLACPLWEQPVQPSKAPSMLSQAELPQITSTHVLTSICEMASPGHKSPRTSFHLTAHLLI